MEYHSWASDPLVRHASVAQADTARWSGWPVMPSGPNVTIVSGRTSSMIPDNRATACSDGMSAQPPSE